MEACIRAPYPLPSPPLKGEGAGENRDLSALRAVAAWSACRPPGGARG